MDKVINLNLDHKTYRKGPSPVALLGHFSLTVAEGEKVAIVGDPGLGKSTLLSILGLLDTCCWADPRLCCRTWNLLHGGTRKSGSSCKNQGSSAP